MIRNPGEHLAVIPARGGSKRIPRKNIKVFNGVDHIIAVTIECLKTSGIFADIYVSTEDDEIGEISATAGAKVLHRPAHLADDHATTGHVMQHAMKELGAVRLTEYVACVYPTAALINPITLARGLQRLQTEPIATYAMPLARHRAPVERALRIDRDTGKIIPPLSLVADSRNQDLRPAYYDPGQWYWGLANAWVNGLPIYHPATIPIYVPPWEAVDIDEPEDFILAEMVALGYAERFDRGEPL